MRVDDNVELLPDGSTQCAHCSTSIGDGGGGALAGALVVERPAAAVGPGLRAAPSLFTDRPIVLRQRLCPGCLVALATEVVPSDEPEFRSWQVEV